MLVIMDDVRVKSVIERAKAVKGLNGYDVLKKIASFDTVEQFQSWKNKLAPKSAYVVGRVGRTNYLKIRNHVRYAK